MNRRNYTAEMRRMALDAVSDFFSVHQAEMNAHELVSSTHLLHTLALAVERSTLWEEKRRQKLGIPDVPERTEHPAGDDYEDDAHDLPENRGPIRVSLGSLESVLKDKSAFSSPAEAIEPVRKPAVEPPIRPKLQPPAAAPRPVQAPRQQPRPAPAASPVKPTGPARETQRPPAQQAARTTAVGQERSAKPVKLQQQVLEL